MGHLSNLVPLSNIADSASYPATETRLGGHIVRISALLALLIAPFCCKADGETLTGLYGHQFTAQPNAPVWSVRSKGKAYQVISLNADESTPDSHEWSKDERLAFWERMLWPPDTSADAQCVGNEDEVICFVPSQSRKRIDWLRESKSDYFHYDPMGGVMKINKLPR